MWPAANAELGFPQGPPSLNELRLTGSLTRWLTENWLGQTEGSLLHCLPGFSKYASISVWVNPWHSCNYRCNAFLLQLPQDVALTINVAPRLLSISLSFDFQTEQIFVCLSCVVCVGRVKLSNWHTARELVPEIKARPSSWGKNLKTKTILDLNQYVIWGKRDKNLLR